MRRRYPVEMALTKKAPEFHRRAAGPLVLFGPSLPARRERTPLRVAVAASSVIRPRLRGVRRLCFGYSCLGVECYTSSHEPIDLTPKGFEVVDIVIEGSVEIKLFGGPHGTIDIGTYVHVREGIRHELSAASDCKVLRMDCGFVAWRGVPTAEDVQ